MKFGHENASTLFKINYILIYITNNHNYHTGEEDLYKALIRHLVTSKPGTFIYTLENCTFILVMTGNIC